MKIFESVLRILLVLACVFFVYSAGLAVGFENGYDFALEESNSGMRFSGGTVYLWIYTLAIRASILSLALFILPLGHKSWIWLAVRFLLSLAICLLLWNFDSAFANIGQNIVDPIYDDLRNIRIFWVLASAILIGTFVAEVVAGVLTRPARNKM